MINIFLTISGLIGVILILIILFQKTEGGSLGLGTQSSITGGGVSQRKSGSTMTKVTYFIAFTFLIWCLAISAFMNRNFAPEINLDNISDQIVIDEDLSEKIPEVPLK